MEKQEKKHKDMMSWCTFVPLVCHDVCVRICGHRV